MGLGGPPRLRPTPTHFVNIVSIPFQAVGGRALPPPARSREGPARAQTDACGFACETCSSDLLTWGGGCMLIKMTTAATAFDSNDQRPSDASTYCFTGRGEGRGGGLRAVFGR